MSVSFEKWHGVGNDFVLLNADQATQDADLSKLAIALCDRRFGVGSDGLLVPSPSNVAQLRYRMFNPDGSESEACGNGLRCFARWAMQAGHIPSGGGTVETARGPLRVWPFTDGAEVEMGGFHLESEPFLDARMGAGIIVGVGNPHVVFTVTGLDALPVADVGPLIEHDSRFPDRTNVHFVEGNRVRHWERGAGETLACGSGACAVAVASTRGISGTTALRLPGGEVQVTIRPDRTLTLAGPAQRSFSGRTSSVSLP